MTNSVMLKLGEYTFSIESTCYQALSRTHKYRWQSTERLNSIDALQFLGESNPVISLSGAHYPFLNGGYKQLDAMRAEAKKGQPLILVDGLGHVHGYWCITQIEERQSMMAAQGVPRKINFTLELTYYDDKLHNR